MWPSKELYLSTIVGALVNVSKCIVTNSAILDLEGTLRDIEKYGFAIAPVNLRSSLNSEDLEKEAEFEKFEREVLQDLSKSDYIKKPVLKPRLFLDKALLSEPLVIPFKEEVLRVDNYSIKAQANPLKSISIAYTLNEE